MDFNSINRSAPMPELPSTSESGQTGQARQSQAAGPSSTPRTADGVLSGVPASPRASGTSRSNVRAALTRPPSTTNQKEIDDKFTAEINKKVLTWFKGRGIENFKNPEGLIQTARALAPEHIKKVMLLTGFSVGAHPVTGLPMPETDGPPGTAALAHALQHAGKIVTIVTDKPNEAPTRAALAVLSEESAKYTRFVNFDHKQADATPHAKNLLDELKPDFVGAVELPGRNALSKDGYRSNMRGISIDDVNGAVDEVLIQAYNRDIPTFGVGDGGNEAGMGGRPGIPKALNGNHMAAAPTAKHQITSWNSNLGAEALGAAVLQLHGKLDKLHTPEQQREMIEASMVAGAVDGVTRGAKVDEEIDGKVSGVDGFSPSTHGRMLFQLRSITEAFLPPDGMLARTTPKSDAPFLISAFDSSNGGLIATKNLAGYLQYRSPHNARFVVVVDHANAPYGRFSEFNTGGPNEVPKFTSADATPQELQRRGTAHPELITLVGNGLRGSEEMSVDLIAMACNTACTTFPHALKQVKDVSVLNLIEVTADEVVKQGGARPTVLATPATINSMAYLKAIDESAAKLENRDERMTTTIGAPNWAPYINKFDEMYKNPETRAVMMDDIKDIVDRIPVDATSVWLCCTHYPAYKPFIENVLKERGMNIPVIDPMSVQAQALEKAMDSAAPKADHPRYQRRATLKPIVVTSGTEADVRESAVSFLGTKDFHLMSGVDFSRKFDMQLLTPLIDKTESAVRATARSFESTRPQTPAWRRDASTSSESASRPLA